MRIPLDPIPPMWKVPTALTPLLGREQEVAALCALLTCSGVRLLVVLQKSEENAEGVKSQFPAQLRQPLQTGWQ
jgi:hypothetical protein